MGADAITIDILGSREGGERELAEALAAGARRLWPDLADDRRDRLEFHVGVKLSGRRGVQDLDIVILVHFHAPRPFPIRGRPGSPAALRNLVAVIEVKGHRHADVRFEGTKALVRYRRGGEEIWEDVTEKSHRQLHALRETLREQGIRDLWVHRFVVLQNLSPSELPRGNDQLVGGTPDFGELLSVALRQGSFERDSASFLSATTPEAMHRIFGLPLFRVLEPSSLDRRRMDRLVRVEAHRADWFEELGRKTIVLRGRGGAGKTVLMLQMAYRLWEEQQARSLFLTYNLALVADIRRTMALMNIPSGLSRGGIFVESVMAFMLRAAKRFGVLSETENPLDDYEEHVGTLAQYLVGEAIGGTDVENLKRRFPEEFAFDQVFVDEGQDWTNAEVAVLRGLYGPERLTIAHGVDQLIRRLAETDWTAGLEKGRVRVRHLRRGLRMKANLARFANRFAAELGLEGWEVQPNTEAGGGRVVIAVGDYFSGPRLHRRLVAEAAEQGNRPIDLLCCVPPALGVDSQGGGASRAARRFEAWGISVWDGARSDVRRSFPNEIEQLRLVQYDSCRGLEGWTVFALGLDAFWRYKFREAQRNPAEPADLFVSPEVAACREAARWLTIPVTRAIDTLVINVSAGDTILLPALRKLADEDYVEWVKL